MLDNQSKYLVYVVVNGIKGNKIEKPDFDIDWKRFFSLSKGNEIFSFVNAVLNPDYLPDELAVKFNNFTKSEMVRIIAMNNELSMVEEQLNEKKINYMLLKGSILRNLYPKQVMRQMSDVDILYDVSRRNDVFEIMKSLDYDEPFKSGNSDDFHKEPYYTFEFHNKLFKDVFGFCPDFSDVWDNATKDESYDSKYVMSNEDFYLHHIAHMYKHYYLGGFGIRFIVDTYLLLTKLELNFEIINKKLEEYMLVDFEENIRNLSLAMFDGELSEKQQSDLDIIIHDGVFGKEVCDNTKAISDVYDRISKENGSDSVAKYALARIFISKDKLKMIYPEIGDRNYLLPFFYLKRMFTKGIGGLFRIIKEIKLITNIKKNKDNEE